MSDRVLTDPSDTDDDIVMAGLPESEPVPATPSRPGRDVVRRLRRNRTAMGSLAFLVLLAGMAVAAPLLTPYDFDQTDFAAIAESPSSSHWLGTDALGRDVLTRILHGARISLSLAFVAQAVILVIGVPTGLLSAYVGGWFDLVVQRLVDILYAFPPLLFVIVVMAWLRPTLDAADGGFLAVVARIDGLTGGLTGVLLAMALILWLTVARLVRAQVLSLKRQEFVQAAESIGSSHLRIMRRHILPNALAPVIIATTFGIPSAIMMEAGLSFLGLGAQPPTPSWGMMISEGVAYLRSDPFLLAAPGLALGLTLLAFNFLGDGLRDALDPHVYDQ